MLKPSLPAPVPQGALHLYRHLLREASYLPPVCQPFISERITARFRKHRPDPDPAPRLHQASHGLRYLRAANAGDMTRMRRVLLLAFGRIGRRRRELLDRLVRKDPPADSAALQELIHSASAGSGSAPADEPDDWLAKWDVEQIRTFLASQSQAGIQSSPRPVLKSKHVNPEKSIPTENTWGRPLHPRLARSKLKKAWKKLIDRVLPPVPHGEWEVLRDLAAGKLTGPEWRVPARRPVAAPSDEAGGQEQPWHWVPYTIQPVRQVERKHSRRLTLMTGSVDDGSLLGSSPAKVHNYTARFWRRLYSHVWHMTATMEKKPVGNGWNIKWGNARLELSPPTASHAEFFQGVSKDGRLSATPAKGQKKQPSPVG